jgi:hypothetical protein
MNLNFINVLLLRCGDQHISATKFGHLHGDFFENYNKILTKMCLNDSRVLSSTS